MKHCYFRIIFLFFTGFLLLAGREASAHGWNYYTDYRKAEGRIYIYAAMNESDCGTCDDDELEDFDIEFSLNNGGWQTLLRDAAHYNRDGNYKSNLLTLGSSGWSGAFEMTTYYVTVPADWVGKHVKIKGHYVWEDSDDEAGDRYHDFDIPTVSAPNITFSANGEQNNLFIDWAQPNTNGYSAGSITYQLFRNGQLLQTFDYNTTAYTDAGTTDGTKYNYQVKAVVNPGNPMSRFEVWGNAVTAWKNPRISFTTSYKDCDTGIQVNWTKPILGAEYSYKITRSTRSNFSAGTFEYNVPDINAQYFYDDGDLSHQKAHYYKIQVLKNGQIINELTSATISIVPDLRPAVPALALEQDGTNFRLSWKALSGADYQCGDRL